MPITANPDAYGRYARLSAVADFVELVAWGGRPVTQAYLADFIGDIEWNLRPEYFYGDGEECDVAEEEQDGDIEEDDTADQLVFDVLSERAAYLGAKYPFALDGSVLSSAANGDFSVYHGLLSITTAHAHGVVPGTNPRALFEATVARLLSERRWQAVNFSGIRSEHGNFEDALVAAGEAIGITADPAAAPHAIAAVDSGVDTLAHHAWGDDRTGRLLLIGQVTCGESGSWKSKIREPSPSEWGRYLDTGADPVRFLAVPHHVQLGQLRYLSETHRSIVIDRIRIALSLDGLTDDERALTAQVRDVDVEFR